MGAEKAGVGAVSEGNINGPNGQGERGLGGVQVEVVEPGNLLIFFQGVGMGSFGLDLFAVGEDIHTEGLGVVGQVGVLGDGELDEQGERSVVGGQFDVEPEPGEGTLMSRWRGELDGGLGLAVLTGGA